MASEYSWGHREILETIYPDEADGIIKAIEKRRLEKRLDNILDNSIPNMEENPRRRAIQELTDKLRAIEGLPDTPPELDRSGLARMKAQLADSKLIKVKSP